jgi:hypothetical protein
MGTSDEAERMKRITAPDHWYVSYLRLANPLCIKRTGCKSCSPDERSPNIRGRVCRLNSAFHSAWWELLLTLEFQFGLHDLQKRSISLFPVLFVCVLTSLS